MHIPLRFFFFVVLLFCWISNVHAQAVFGWIVEARGVIEVRSAEDNAWKEIDTTLEYELKEGDRIRTAKESTAVLLTQDAREIEVQPEVELLLKPSDASSSNTTRSKNDDTVASRLKFVLKQTFKRRKPFNPGIRRGVGSDPPVLVYPRAGNVLSANPDFLWLSASPEADSYQLRVMDKVTDKVWLELTVHDTTAVYPAGLNNLDAGTEYRVVIHPSNKPEDSAKGAFYVASDDERERYSTLREDLMGRYSSGVSADILLASMFLEDEYYADALHILLEIERSNGGSPLVNYLKSQVYYEAGPMLLIP